MSPMLQKLEDRLSWVLKAKQRLSMQPTETSDPQISSALWTLKITMIEHLELEVEFLTEAIAEERSAT